MRIELGPFVADGMPTLTVEGQVIPTHGLMVTYWSAATRQPSVQLDIVTDPEPWAATTLETPVEVLWLGAWRPGRLIRMRQEDFWAAVAIVWPSQDP